MKAVIANLGHAVVRLHGVIARRWTRNVGGTGNGRKVGAKIQVGGHALKVIVKAEFYARVDVLASKVGRNSDCECIMVSNERECVCVCVRVR